MKQPVRVAITGAAGQIGYQLCFRIAAGDMLGPDQPVILQLLEITPAMGALEGVVMELKDSALPLLQDVEFTDDANVAFKDTDYALRVGANDRIQVGVIGLGMFPEHTLVFDYSGERFAVLAP